jgi:hypothetical protein
MQVRNGLVDRTRESVIYTSAAFANANSRLNLSEVVQMRDLLWQMAWMVEKYKDDLSASHLKILQQHAETLLLAVRQAFDEEVSTTDTYPNFEKTTTRLNGFKEACRILVSCPTLVDLNGQNVPEMLRSFDGLSNRLERFLESWMQLKCSRFDTLAQAKEQIAGYIGILASLQGGIEKDQDLTLKTEKTSPALSEWHTALANIFNRADAAMTVNRYLSSGRIFDAIKEAAKFPDALSGQENWAPDDVWLLESDQLKLLRDQVGQIRQALFDEVRKQTEEWLQSYRSSKDNNDAQEAAWTNLDKMLKAGRSGNACIAEVPVRLGLSAVMKELSDRTKAQWIPFIEQVIEHAEQDPDPESSSLSPFVVKPSLWARIKKLSGRDRA